MKKYFLIFTAISFMNISDGMCEYFTASNLEKTIAQEFTVDVQPVVINEYEAQMDPDTGEIDEQGFYNVCYAGGYDVSTETGTEQCSNFLNELEDNEPQYTAEYPKSEKACAKNGNPALTEGCKYSDYAQSYNNPTTTDEKIRKCILNKTVDWAIDNYEGGFGQRRKDSGNRICDANGNALYEDGSIVDVKNINPNKKIQLGATKFGVTTCYTGLSVKCICGMTKTNAKQFYWGMAKKYGYFKLPQELFASIVQFSFAGVGTVRSDFNKIFGTQCGWVVDDCHINSLKAKYYDKEGNLLTEKFYEDICNAHAKRFIKKGKIAYPKHHERALRTKELKKIHGECLKELGIHR